MAIRFAASIPETAVVAAEVACAENSVREAAVRGERLETQFDRRGMASARSDGWLTVESQMTRCCHRGEETHLGLQGWLV
jgi:hypothetical protein